jgi:hypothetical protein
VNTSTEVPRVDQLRAAPELAVLAALDAVAMATIGALLAAHPELLDPNQDPLERTLHVADAAAICRHAEALVASIRRYRPDIDDEPF